MMVAIPVEGLSMAPPDGAISWTKKVSSSSQMRSLTIAIFPTGTQTGVFPVVGVNTSGNEPPT